MIIHSMEQGTEEWFRVRAGIPTASEFGRLVTPTGKPSKSIDGYAADLAAEVIVGIEEGWEGNEHTQRGHDGEDPARTWYEFMTDQTIEQVGFVTTDDGLYGCSPDGMVGKGAVEIKSKKASIHLKAIAHIKKTGQVLPEHKAQIQGVIMIAERAWCDLILYHEKIPPFSFREEPDKKYQKMLRDQLRLVIEMRDELVNSI